MKRVSRWIMHLSILDCTALATLLAFRKQKWISKWKSVMKFASKIAQICLIAGCLSHLHKDLESVERRCSCPGHWSRHSACHQLPPHEPWLLLLLRELIRDRQMLSDIQHLHQTHHRIHTMELKKERGLFYSLSCVRFASYHRVFPELSDFLHVVQRVKQEVISPLHPVDSHGMVFVHTEWTHFRRIACHRIT